MHNTVVVHFLDGKLLKGTANDFFPARPSFHLNEDGTGTVTEIQFEGLKAMFFVKSLVGDTTRQDNQDSERTGFGRRIMVSFQDGETIHGYTSGYAPNRPTFFVFPADPESNNEKIFVIASAATDVRFE